MSPDTIVLLVILSLIKAFWDTARQYRRWDFWNSGPPFLMPRARLFVEHSSSTGDVMFLTSFEAPHGVEEREIENNGNDWVPCLSPVKIFALTPEKSSVIINAVEGKVLKFDETGTEFELAPGRYTIRAGGSSAILYAIG